jgi:hypothetical protein
MKPIKKSFSDSSTYTNLTLTTGENRCIMDKIINSSEFKRDLERAKKDKRDRFTYKGDNYLVEYAEYLVQYMAVLEKQRDKRNQYEQI